jgi:hypothetical protein
MKAPRAMIPITIPAIAPTGRDELFCDTLTGIAEPLIFASDANVDVGVESDVLVAATIAFGTLLEVPVEVVVGVASGVSVRAFDVELSLSVVVFFAIVFVSKLTLIPTGYIRTAKKIGPKVLLDFGAFTVAPAGATNHLYG